MNDLAPAPRGGRLSSRGIASERVPGEHVDSSIRPMQNAIVLRTLREKAPG